MAVRLSYTSTNKYLASPRAWYLHYVKRLRPRVTGSALVFGGAIDTGLNSLLSGTGVAEAEKAFLEAFETNKYNDEVLDLATTDKVKWSKTDYIEEILLESDRSLIASGSHPSWVSVRRKGLMMLSAYNEQVMPHISEVVAIQDKVRIENELGDTIDGFIDFAAKFKFNPEYAFDLDPGLAKYDDKIIIFDNKTTTAAYKENAVRVSDQLGTYIENPNLKYEADAAGYIVIPKIFRKRKLPQIPIKIMIDQVDPKVIAARFKAYEKTLNGIKMEQFDCTPEKCCNGPYGCVYRDYCSTGSLNGLVELKS